VKTEYCVIPFGRVIDTVVEVPDVTTVHPDANRATRYRTTPAVATGVHTRTQRLGCQLTVTLVIAAGA
jgi:hypothetical protein